MEKMYKNLHVVKDKSLVGSRCYLLYDRTKILSCPLLEKEADEMINNLSRIVKFRNWRDFEMSLYR